MKNNVSGSFECGLKNPLFRTASAHAGLTFHKMQALRNDFVIVLGHREGVALSADDIDFLCDRKAGVGCDQLMLVTKGVGQYNVEIYNADGSKAAACGNGMRCVAMLLCEIEGVNRVSIKAGDRIIDANTSDIGGNIGGVTEIGTCSRYVTVNMGGYKIVRGDLHGESLAENTTAVTLGNDHIVLFDGIGCASVGDIVCDEDYLRIISEGKSIFHKGNNCTVMMMKDNGDIAIRTYERGVGMTDACGTAACASYIAAIDLVSRGKLQSNISGRVEMLGGEVSIALDENGSLLLSGNANYVFSGEIGNKCISEGPHV